MCSSVPIKAEMGLSFEEMAGMAAKEALPEQ